MVSDRDGRREGKDMKKGWFVVSDRDGRRKWKDIKRGGLWSVTEMEEEKGKT